MVSHPAARVYFRAFLRIAFTACVVANVISCAPHVIYRQGAYLPQASPAQAPRGRDLFVFFDGTTNDERSGTNVWRLFQLVTANGDSSTKSIYINGVGNAPLPLTGATLGSRLQTRILRGYDFLTVNFKPGDSIRIFGFSRGALEARALAGLVAYAGLPEKVGSASAILSIVKKERDAEQDWSTWGGPKAFLASKIFSKLKIEVFSVPIALVGVWETVPGSAFKNYPPNSCKERDEPADGDRYKTGSYPPITRLVQALAHDEYRSMFRPILLCEPVSAATTMIKETWFSGAHSDVGGGYDDTYDLHAGPALANAPFNWMVQELQNSGYRFAIAPTALPEDHAAPAHWSLKGIAAAGSHCEARTLSLKPDGHREQSGQLSARLKAGKVPLVDAPEAMLKVPGAGPQVSQAEAVEVEYPYRGVCGNPVDIVARDYWNNTGIVLERGVRYKLTAEGEWKDRSIVSSASGYSRSLNWLQRLTQHLRRAPELRWFALVGALDRDLSTRFLIGESVVYTPIRDGQLTCFANDLRGFYSNNSGSVRLTVERINKN